jgi:hypothetical protein
VQQSNQNTTSAVRTKYARLEKVKRITRKRLLTKKEGERLERIRGEIKTEFASSGGRIITLDPIKTFSVPIELREVESTAPCGFRVEWFTGEDSKIKFKLCVGAGVGSKWMTFRYGNRQFCVDMAQTLEHFVNTVKKKKR